MGKKVNKSRSLPPPQLEKGVEKGTNESLSNNMSLPMTMFVAFLAMFVTYHLTVKVLTQVMPATSRTPSETIIPTKGIKEPLPCGASNYIADVSVPGLHLVCFESSQNTTDNTYVLNVYRNSLNPAIQFKVNRESPDVTFKVIQATLETELNIQSHSVNPWALFTATGENISSLQEMLSQSTTFVYEGGSFIWPGVRVGYSQVVPLDNGKSALMETLSMRPLIFSIKDFLSESECNYIQQHAGPHMAQSGVSLMDKDVGKEATEWRTSKTYFMASKNHHILQQIDTRVAALTKKPTTHQELVQVLKYGNGQKYDAHHDYFDPKLYTKDKRTLDMIKNGKTNRMATVLWYLSDVEGGGHTVFPQFGGTPPPRNMASCDKGLKVSPEKGKVIMFYSLLPDGKIDRYSLHGSCPVVGDKEKWAANKWIWSSPMTSWGITN